MKEIDISVVIPYYNDSIFLKRTIDSIFKQTLKASEIIIVDDCSQDSNKAIEIINSYASELRNKIRYHRNEKNMNGSYSRNFGIKKAEYSYIALLDADDFWGETHLEVNVREIKRTNADFIFSNYLFKDVKGRVYKNKVTNIEEINNPNDILFYKPPQTNSFFMKKKSIVQANIYFNEELRRHQDWQYLIDIINSKVKYIYLDEYTSYYCQPTRSVLSIEGYHSIFKFWDKNYNKFSENLVLKFIKKIILIACLSYGYEVIDSNFYKYKVFQLVKNNRFFILFIESYFMKNKNIAKILYFIFFDFKGGVDYLKFRFLK